MKKKVNLLMQKQLGVCVNEKIEAKLKKLMKKLKLKSISETIRHCIENFQG